MAYGYDIKCVGLRAHDTVGQSVSKVMHNMQRTDIDLKDEPLRVEPRLANLRGPAVTLVGRDVRLTLDHGQSSPQELWFKAQWDGNSKTQAQNCADPHGEPKFLGFSNLMKYGTYTDISLINDLGGLLYKPFIMYRSRLAISAMVLRPYGLVMGGGMNFPIASNTYLLGYMDDNDRKVRRDMSHFDNTPALSRLYAGWQFTPMNYLHVAVTGGYLEDMYAGVGAEAIYRPFPSLFWVGADVWQVWRRDNRSTMNMKISGENTFTAHLRAGYDFANTRTGLYGAIGRYLGRDLGATIGLKHVFENGARLDGHVTWSRKAENEGIFNFTHIEPMVTLRWPLSPWFGPRHTRSVQFSARQMGRDYGQMLERPRPLEDVTQVFSARDIARDWPQMFEKDKKREIRKAPF